MKELLRDLHHDFSFKSAHCCVGVIVGTMFFIVGLLIDQGGLTPVEVVGQFFLSALLAFLVALAFSTLTSLRDRSEMELAEVKDSAKRELSDLANQIASCALEAPTTLELLPDDMAPGGAVCSGFRDIAKASAGVNPKGVRSILARFMRESLKSIVDKGFVLADAEFVTYREKANNIVNALYESPEPGDIWMNCLYSPLEYLLMLIYGKDEEDSPVCRPDHLRVFNGLKADGQAIPNSDTTNRLRVVYLDRKKVERALAPPSSDQQEDTEFRDPGCALCIAFAYIWFILASYRIHHIWRWVDDYGTDLGIEKEKDQVDFLVINKRYFWIYNISKETLLACWQWSKLVNHRSEQMLTLFGHVLKKEGGRKYKRSLPELLEVDRSSGLCEQLRTATKRALDQVQASTSWATPDHRDSAVYDKPLHTLRNEVFPEALTAAATLDSFVGFEEALVNAIEDLGEQERAEVNSLIHSQVFGEILTAVFPGYTDRTLIGDWVHDLLEGKSEKAPVAEAVLSG